MADKEGGTPDVPKAPVAQQDPSSAGDASLSDVNNHCAMPLEAKGDEGGDEGTAAQDCDNMENNHAECNLSSVSPLASSSDSPSAYKHASTSGTSLQSATSTPSQSHASQDLPLDTTSASPIAAVGNASHTHSDKDMECSHGMPADSSLKKDDSGIDIERSPAKDSCSITLDDTLASQDMESSKLSGGDGKWNLSSESPEDKLRGDRPSTSNESEGVVADHVDMEEESEELDIEDAAMYDPTQRAEEDINIDLAGVMVAESFNRVQERARAMQQREERKRRRSGEAMDHIDNDNDTESRDSDDDNVDDDDNEDDEDDEDEDENGQSASARHDRSSSEDEMEVDVNADIPKDRWRPWHEVRHREMGYANHVPMSDIFRTKCGGSISLTRRLELYTKLERHEGCVNALHFNRSGTLLSSGSDDLNIVIWDWVRKKPAFTFDSGHRSNVFQCKFMPYTGDCHLVSCARDGQVRLAELSSMETCKGTRKLAQHKGAAHKLALLEDSSHVFYSCGEDAAMMEIDLRQDKPNKLGLTKENDRKVALYSIHANPFKSYEYCVGGRDHYVRIYDKRMISEEAERDGVVKKYCPSHLVDSEVKANVTCAVYNYNGLEVLGTYNDEDIYLFDNTHSDGASHIHKYVGHRNNATVKGVNFYGPESEFVVSGSDCGNVFLWDKDTEKIVQYFHGDDGGVVNVLEPHPSIPLLATSGLDHDVKIWLPTAKEPTELKGLKQVMKRNKKERDEERVNEPDMIDSQMLWFLMQNLRRSARRRARQEGEDISSSSDSENDSDDSEEHAEPVTCAPS